MTLPLQAVADPATDQNHRQIAQQFPIQAANIANGAVGSKALAKASVTDEKLAKPVIAGAVKANGELESGTGFTVSKVSTGIYKIILTTEPATTPVPVATIRSERAAVYISAIALSKTEIRVGCSNVTTFAAEDAAFTFMVKAS